MRSSEKDYWLRLIGRRIRERHAQARSEPLPPSLQELLEALADAEKQRAAEKAKFEDDQDPGGEGRSE